MTPFYTDDWLTLYGGDCREVLASLPADSVDCVVTSPPYYSLRDYGVAGQIGMERTPAEYVEAMVGVFREVRRVIKPTATVWLNLGDSFGDKQLLGIPWRVAFALQADGWYLRSDIIWSKPNPMPESVTDRPTKSHEYLFLLTKSARYYFDADAVREPHVRLWDGSKPNGRTLAGGSDYTIQAGAPTAHVRQEAAIEPNPAGRNIRSVWNIATRPYPGAHFAVFPPELPERCIKAGSSEKGVCPECGAPWERVVERQRAPRGDSMGRKDVGGFDHGQAGSPYMQVVASRLIGWSPTCEHGVPVSHSDDESVPVGVVNDALDSGVLVGGLDPVLDNFGDDPSRHGPSLAPAVILDPFGGSGTVGMVANRLSRRAILIDLNPEYLKQQMKRNAQTPLGLDAA